MPRTRAISQVWLTAFPLLADSYLRALSLHLRAEFTSRSASLGLGWRACADDLAHALRSSEWYPYRPLTLWLQGQCAFHPLHHQIAPTTEGLSKRILSLASPRISSTLFSEFDEILLVDN